MTSTGAVAGVAFLAYLEHPLAPRPRPGQIVVLDRLGGAPQTGGAGGDRSAGVRVGAVAWVRPGLQPHRVGFQQDRGVRESCGGEGEGERWTQRSRLRWGRCRWGMWWVGLSMPESRITHCENRCKVVTPVVNCGRRNRAKSSSGYLACLSLKTKPTLRTIAAATVMASWGEPAPQLGPSMMAKITAETAPIDRSAPGMSSGLLLGSRLSGTKNRGIIY